MTSEAPPWFRTSRAYRVLVRAGLCGYGLVHLVIAGLAVAVAFGAEAHASQVGAVRALSDRPLGFVLLLGVGVGMLGCAVWQVVEALFGRPTGAELRWTRKFADLGRAAAYTSLGLLALGTIVREPDPDPDGPVTEQLLATDWGSWAIVVVGIVIGVVGAFTSSRGFKRRFREDLNGSAGHPTVVLGIVGHLAKGVVYLILGGLIALAGLTDDADGVGGMDVALARLGAQPFGAELLVVMAVGLGCFGLYCFAWAWRARV